MQFFKVAVAVAVALFAVLAGTNAQPVGNIGGSVGGGVNESHKDGCAFC